MDKLMLLAFYNNIVDEEVEKILKKESIAGFSIIENIKGKGKSSGFHLGDSVFPDLNNAVFIVDTQDKINTLKKEFAGLKEKYPEEGMKIFILPVIEAI